MSNAKTKYYIYPAIGIARVGNSPTGVYFGPETPTQLPPESFSYKDEDGKVKRQGVKFRIYEIDDTGEVLREVITDEQTTIKWEVHIANRKAINYQFNNAMDLGDIALESRLRNENISDWDERRKQLLIDPGARTISGKNESGEKHYFFDSGTFFGKKVPLGEVQTDTEGRLIVLGGFGHSANKEGAQAITFANNDGWHDDVSDGTVRATLDIGGECIEVAPAMVAVTPANFGPGLRSVVTMYDVVEDLFIREGHINTPAQVEFWRDIYPIFQRLVENQAVNEGIYFQFGQNSPGDLTSPELLKKLASNSAEHKSLRAYLFQQFRDPSSSIREDAKQPPFYGDAFGDFNNTPLVNLSLTHTQYTSLGLWAEGKFNTNGDTPPLEQTFDELPLNEQPRALTQTNLLECLGGPFHPGIELTWFLRRISMWNVSDTLDPMRLNILPIGQEPQDDFGPVLRPQEALAHMFNTSGPGTLTRFMGVPWQTDEASCRSGYDTALYLPTPSFWSARVPNQVMSTRSLERVDDPELPAAQRIKHLDHRQDWLRFFAGGYESQINAMVENWHEIGIIKRRTVHNGDPSMGIPKVIWTESELAKRLTENDPSYKQLLALENITQQQDVESFNSACEIDEEQTASEDPKNRPIYRRDQR